MEFVPPQLFVTVSITETLCPRRVVAYVSEIELPVSVVPLPSVQAKELIVSPLPAVEAAKQKLAAGGSEQDCLSAAAEGARSGADATKDMRSGRGRSKKLGDRSVGHIDPGAESTAVLLRAWAKTVS